MNSFLLYIYYPNPGHLAYSNTLSLAVFALCGGLIILSFLVRFWRSRLTNAITKKLSRAWSSTAFWFGLAGLILIISRIEKIQFIAMRFLWVLWVAFFVLAIIIQYRIFRMRHYEVMPRVGKVDPRDHYLPGKK